MNFLPRQQEKNTCVAHAVTRMNEVQHGSNLQLDVSDLVTSTMAASGEHIHQVVLRASNKGQSVICPDAETARKERRKLSSKAIRLQKPYSNSIKKALASGRGVAVTISHYQHKQRVQRCRDRFGERLKKRARPHAIFLYGFDDQYIHREAGEPEGVFYFLNSHGKWIEGSEGTGLLTYETADKEIIEAYAAAEAEKCKTSTLA